LKLHGFLPTLGTLAVFACASIAASAQASNPSPAVHASLAIPTTSSSSSSSAVAALATPAVPAAAAASAPAPAAPEVSQGGPFSGLGVGFKLGVAGIGFDVATPIVPTRLNLRGGATFFSYNLSDTTSDGETINGTLKLQNSGIMADWFPFRGSFRLSGGVTVYNNKGLTGTANLADGKSMTLGNDKYYAIGNLGGTAAVKLGGNTGGRVSFGFGNLVPKKGHHFSFDTELGIEFVSAPTVALAFTGNVCPSANYQSTTDSCTGGNQNASTYAPFLTDVTAEQNKYQNDLNFVKFYPIVSVGFGWRLF
jgi:hypothetical protein